MEPFKDAVEVVYEVYGLVQFCQPPRLPSGSQDAAGSMAETAGGDVGVDKFIKLPGGAASSDFKQIKKNRFLIYFGGAGVVPIDSSRKTGPKHGFKSGF